MSSLCRVNIIPTSYALTYFSGCTFIKIFSDFLSVCTDLQFKIVMSQRRSPEQGNGERDVTQTAEAELRGKLIKCLRLLGVSSSHFVIYMGSLGLDIFPLEWCALLFPGSLLETP